MVGLNAIIDRGSGENIAFEQVEVASGVPRVLEPRSLKRLIDFLFLSSNQIMPGERAMAENLLIRDFDALPAAALERLAHRLAASRGVAPGLCLKLARCGRTEFSSPVLRNAKLSDIDIAEIARSGSISERMAIAQRDGLSSIVVNILIGSGEPEVMNAVLQNQGAYISGTILSELIARSKTEPNLQNALLFRPEITAALAMDLFWQVPGEVREYILLTYLCDQHSLQGILRDDAAWQEDQRTLHSAKVGDELIKTLAKHAINAETDAAIKLLACEARVAPATATRILEDSGGEPFLVAAKALGASRAGVNEALMWLTNAKPDIIASPERLEPLRSLFDRMSRGQAQAALQYWNLALSDPPISDPP